jgi:hypothetical protein
LNAGGGVQAGGWDAITGGGAAAGAGPAGFIGFPQPTQKRFPSGARAPHCEQNIGILRERSQIVLPGGVRYKAPGFRDRLRNPETCESFRKKRAVNAVRLSLGVE